MAASAAAAREFERAEENSEGSPIPTLERAIRRTPSSSSRADNKGGWSNYGHKSVMNPPENYQKFCNAYQTMTACN